MTDRSPRTSRNRLRNSFPDVFLVECCCVITAGRCIGDVWSTSHLLYLSFGKRFARRRMKIDEEKRIKFPGIERRQIVKIIVDKVRSLNFSIWLDRRRRDENVVWSSRDLWRWNGGARRNCGTLWNWIIRITKNRFEFFRMFFRFFRSTTISTEENDEKNNDESEENANDDDQRDERTLGIVQRILLKKFSAESRSSTETKNIFIIHRMFVRQTFIEKDFSAMICNSRKSKPQEDKRKKWERKHRRRITQTNFCRRRFSLFERKKFSCLIIMKNHQGWRLVRTRKRCKRKFETRFSSSNSLNKGKSKE